MTVNFIIYCVFMYFAALLVAGALCLSKKTFQKGSALFVIANVLGFLTGLVYLINFSDQQIVLAQWDWLLGFSPTMTFLGAIFFTLISGVSALVGTYAVRYLKIYEKTYNPQTTQFLTTLFVLGMQGVLFANNSFIFLFFWELMSITSFFLVLADKTQESVKAAFLYFIMTHLGASAILGGFLILAKGSLIMDFSNISIASQNLSPVLLAVTFLLFLFGFGSKAGLVPFHVWLPEAHPQAPSNVSALMSGLMLKVAVYGFIRVVFSFFELPSWAGLAVIGLGLLSGLVGVLYALIERDMKRAFAYSSIENMGIIFTMLGLAIYLLSQNNISLDILAIANVIVIFAIFHAINHALFKTALFLSSGVIISRFHTRRLELMGGLAKIMPVFSFAFLIAILSSLPLPPFGTFYGEWGLIQNVISLLHYGTAFGTNPLLVSVIILSLIALISGLAIFAMIKIFGISTLGLTRCQHLETSDEKADRLLTFPIMILGGGVLALGILAKPIISWMFNRVGLLSVESIAVYDANTGNFFSLAIFVMFGLFLFLAYALKNFLTKEKLEREYVTWDCGQPIDASMEYTATAFTGPIRSFFKSFIRIDKELKSAPVVETNPWIRKYEFTLVIESIWKERLYEPAAKILNFIADRIKVIQSGRIQYYLMFLLVTLILTLIIVL